MDLTNYFDEKTLIELAHSTVTCVLNNSFHIEHINLDFTSSLDIDSSHLIGKTLIESDIINLNESSYNFIISALKENITWHGELQFNNIKDKILWLECSIKPIITNFEEQHYIVTLTDITARRELINHLKSRAKQQSLIAILGQLSLNNIPIDDLLEQALSVICGSLNMNSAIIMELAINAQSSLVRATYNTKHSIAGKTIIPVEANSILSETLISTRPIFSDISNNETDLSIPDIFIKENINSISSILIGDKHYPFGILALFSSKEKKLNLDEINFIQSVCNILAEAINRQNMEKSLRHEKELSRKYLNVAEIFFIVTDISEKIILVNKYAEKLLGYEQKKLLGINFVDHFIAEEDRKKLRDFFKTLIKNIHKEDKTHGIIIPIINKSNKKSYIRWNISILYNDNNEIESILSAGEDITEILKAESEQKELEKKLYQAQKLETIGMLTGGIAHDFNNILASILGFTELALESTPNEDIKTHDYLQHVAKSGRKARDIIAQLQNINIEDDSSSNSVILPSLLKGTLKMLRSALPSSIELNLNIHNDTPAVCINASKFNQIVMHLLTNSRNALNGKGIINLNLSLEEIKNSTCSHCNQDISEEYVVLEILDNGPGFNDNKIHSIFSSEQTHGLPIISQLIHQDDGHIIISNHSRQYTGAHIRLLFKLAAKNSTLERKKYDTDLSLLKGKHIMIVDDENSVASFMGELFNNMGFKTSVYCDPSEALKSFKDDVNAYDLVITDQTMPILTGDLLAIKMLKIKPEIPIIICTGHSDSLDKIKADDLKIKGFLKKPVDSAELLHMVSILLTE